MRKAEELYMKLIYTMEGMENKHDTAGVMEVVINKVNTLLRYGSK